MKEHSIDKATVPFAPVYDVRNDLYRIRGITAAVAYLTSPVHLKEDDDFEIFHEVLMEISDRLDAAREELSKAINEVKFGKEVQ